MASVPKGTLHRRKIPYAQTKTQDGLPDVKPCTAKDLEGLGQTIAEQFGWKDGPRLYQMEGINAQLQKRDVLIHAGTGMGKTAVAAGPHVHPSSKGKVTIMVLPLIALHDEMVTTFREEFKLNATAVNSSNGGCTPNALEDIIKGKNQIVLISPELLLSRRFIKVVLKNPEFKRRVLSVFIDEAHVISHWGNGFRKKYGELGMIRAFLPKSTPIVAVSATLPARVRRDIIQVLKYDKQNFVNIDIGNDRPNVSIVIRAIHYPLNTYADLNFVISDTIQCPTEIPKTFIYCDNIAMGAEIIDHLIERLPLELRYLGLIRPYNACFSKEYRLAVMQEFKEGRVRIQVCTDAAGMGCNIPDIDLVVQWKLPGSISALVQRAGRCARASGTVGLAVLLVEPSVYSTILDEHGAKPVGGKNSAKTVKTNGVKYKPPTSKEIKTKKTYAERRGLKRGSQGGKHDAILVQDCPPIDSEATDEGLYTLVQAGTCRRNILSLVFGNAQAQPTVPCCDICDPSLLNRTRPGTPSKPPRQKKVKQGEICRKTEAELHTWRTTVKKRDFRHALFSIDAFLPDAMVSLLSSVGPIKTRGELSVCLSGEWGWESTYGDELYSKLTTLDVPLLVPLPAKNARGSKRPVDVGSQQDGGNDKPTKRPKATLTALQMEPLISHEPASFLSSEGQFQLTGYRNGSFGEEGPSLEPTISTFRAFGESQSDDETTIPMIWVPSVTRVNTSQLTGPSRVAKHDS